MKKLLFIICAVLCIGSSFSQTLFSNRYTANHFAAIFESICVKDTTVVVSGLVSHSIYPYAAKNLMSCFNLEGQIIYQKKYTGEPALNYGTFYNSLIPTTDGGFAVTGYTQDTTGKMQVLFMKFDSLGDTLFVKQYDDGDTNNVFLNGQSIMELGNGYMIAGDKQVRTTPSNYNCDIHLLRTDSSGNIKWWKTYGTPQWTEANVTLLPLTETTILVGYLRSNWFIGGPQSKGYTTLIKIDTAGNVLSQWQDTNDSSGWAYGLLKTKDNGFAYCGMFKYAQPVPWDYTEFQGCITKLDSAFNLVWRKRLGFPTSMTLLYELKELSDGSLIAVGAHFDTLVASTGWLVKLSAGGDSIWDRRYKSVGNTFEKSELYDFELLPDGGIIACGISQDNTVNYQSQRGWLIRLDTMGCLIPGCDTINATAIKETPTEAIGIKVYPNPASNMVYVLLKSDEPAIGLRFTVYNLNGEKIAEESHTATDITYLLNVSNYAKGVYVIEVSTSTKVLASRKFIKE